MRIDEVRLFINKVIKETLEEQLDYGWGVKKQYKPDLPWIKGHENERRHQDTDVYKKFMYDILDLKL